MYKKLYTCLLVAVSILSFAQGYASDIKNLFTTEEITHGTETLVRVSQSPLSAIEGDHQQLIMSHGVPIGLVELNQNIIKIFFRGEIGRSDYANHFQADDKPILQNLRNLYMSSQQSLWDIINTHAQNMVRPVTQMYFQIFGHSLGTTLVPQMVDDLINNDVPVMHIRALGTSPVGVYNKRKQEEYNNQFGHTRHINFKHTEDKFGRFITKIQNRLGIYSVLKDRVLSVKHYETGHTVEYSAGQLLEFNQWVANQPYQHAYWGFSYLLWPFIKATTWNAHLPEAYDISAVAYLNTL